MTKTFMVARTDRAGDLILTLPIFRELRKKFPESRIIAHVRGYTAPLIQLCTEVDEIIVDDEFSTGILSRDLKKKYKQKNIDYAIIVHPAARPILAAWSAGIPVRTGRASNVWQLFLNNRKIQKRSRNEKHEFCYNLDLLEGLIDKPLYEPYAFSSAILNRFCYSLSPEIESVLSHRPVVIHPGHGGSAFNPDPLKYSALADKLIKNNRAVLISIGPGEEHMKQYFSPMIPGKLGFLENVPDLARLAAIFSRCCAFAGGSTGPLHLAASTGLPCVAFFPPVKAMTPKRWGPTGSRSIVLTPSVDPCEGKCKTCRHFGCMDTINIADALKWLLEET